MTADDGRLVEPITLHSQLLIGSRILAPHLVQQLGDILRDPDYALHQDGDTNNFLYWVGGNRHRVDCLLIESDDSLQILLDQLRSRDILLPVVILLPALAEAPAAIDDAAEAPLVLPGCSAEIRYHNAIACLASDRLSLLEQYIHQAIDEFLHLPHSPTPFDSPDIAPASPLPSVEDTRHFLLSLQQQRLTEKLRERLGYLGVYYKRNPQNFLRNLSPEERAEVINTLKNDYRVIILTYFSQDAELNQRIDDFVNVAFFADTSVSQIVEIHMDLMDDFSKQLKLEGRSEEILLDYRLTLIDVMAHLCEMYRRSIPREL